MRIAVGSDHAGFPLKEAVRAELVRLGHEVTDVGTGSASESVDYPDFAIPVAERVAHGEADRGVVVCATGIGVSIAANKVEGVRASVVTSDDTARLTRADNDSNVLALGAKTAPGTADALRWLRVWLETPFAGGRHERRVEKIRAYEESHVLPHGREGVPVSRLQSQDPVLFGAIVDEERRQRSTLELIASENFVSDAVLEAAGSVLTNKYAEGLPGKRYYGGCEFVDVAENLARDRVKQLFAADHANVQPHSGASANLAAYLAVSNPGDTLMGMSLAHGGHLTHGHAVSVSGRLWKSVQYGVRAEDGRIDYDEVERLAKEHRPRILVAGASAHPRILDFARFGAIADEVGAVLVVDMAHIAGLVAAGLHPSPVPHAAVVTSTTHKTLRGPRGGIVLARRDWAEKIDKSMFPGLQGGPLMHVIAAKAACFGEALTEGFVAYQRRVVENARVLGETLVAHGFDLVSGGTDNHLLLVDLRRRGLTGKVAEESLHRALMTVNKNAVPDDPEKPWVTSGIRVGTPALTTRGMGPDEMRLIGGWMAKVLGKPGDAGVAREVEREVRELTQGYPLFSWAPVARPAVRAG